jgi:hypothetical protein
MKGSASPESGPHPPSRRLLRRRWRFRRGRSRRGRAPSDLKCGRRLEATARAALRLRGPHSIPEGLPAGLLRAVAGPSVVAAGRRTLATARHQVEPARRRTSRRRIDWTTPTVATGPCCADVCLTPGGSSPQSTQGQQGTTPADPSHGSTPFAYTPKFFILRTSADGQRWETCSRAGYRGGRIFLRPTYARRNIAPRWFQSKWRAAILPQSPQDSPGRLT